MKKAKGTPRQNKQKMDKTGHLKHVHHMANPNLAPQTQSKNLPANSADKSLKKLKSY